MWHLDCELGEQELEEREELARWMEEHEDMEEDAGMLETWEDIYWAELTEEEREELRREAEEEG